MVATFTIEAEILVYIEKERVCPEDNPFQQFRKISIGSTMSSRCSNPPAALPHNNRKD
jgi:hypothetical protein